MKFNLTLDAPSPLLSYSSGWGPINATSDLEARFYKNGTAAVTESVGASMSFRWIGTGVWVFGARRFNHGAFLASVDQTDAKRLNTSSVQSIYQDILFASTILPNGTHQLTLTNAGAGSLFDGDFFDIDYLQFEVDAPNNTTENIFDNTDANKFHFLPSSDAWQVSSDSAGNSSFGGSVSRSMTSDASVRLDFEGTMVALYGPMGPAGDKYSCSLDGGPPVVHDANYPVRVDQQMLCLFQALMPGNHTVVMKPEGGQSLSVDYARAWSGPPSNTTARTTSPATPVGTSSKSSASQVSKPVFIGVTIGGIVLLILVGILAFLFLRRRRQSYRGKHNRRPENFTIEEASIRSFPSFRQFKTQRISNPVPIPDTIIVTTVSRELRDPNPYRKSVAPSANGTDMMSLPTPPFDARAPEFPSPTSQLSRDTYGLVSQLPSTPMTVPARILAVNEGFGENPRIAPTPGGSEGGGDERPLRPLPTPPAYLPR